MARSPSACSGSCSWGCSGRRCPAPERRAPQVSASAGLPEPLRPSPLPGRRKLATMAREGQGWVARVPSQLPDAAAGSRRAQSCARSSRLLVVLLSCCFSPHLWAGETFRGCYEYFHLLPPTCRNLSLECFGVAGWGAAFRPPRSAVTRAASWAARSWSGEHRSLVGPGCQGGGFFVLLGDAEDHTVLF